MYCSCVNVYCHRVSTQLQLTDISIISIYQYNSIKIPSVGAELFDVQRRKDGQADMTMLTVAFVQICERD
jgi:hypothetical protein